MEDQAEATKTYTVPAEVQAALATGRPALLLPLRNRIRAGQVPTPEEWMGVVDMMGDIIVDRQHERVALREEREALASRVEEFMRGQIKRMNVESERLVDVLQGFTQGSDGH